jgi:hypothetical protein
MILNKDDIFVQGLVESTFSFAKTILKKDFWGTMYYIQITNPNNKLINNQNTSQIFFKNSQNTNSRITKEHKKLTYNTQNKQYLSLPRLNVEVVAPINLYEPLP